MPLKTPDVVGYTYIYIIVYFSLAIIYEVGLKDRSLAKGRMARKGNWDCGDQMGELSTKTC